jgi:hypothetical protein
VVILVERAISVTISLLGGLINMRGCMQIAAQIGRHRVVSLVIIEAR